MYIPKSDGRQRSSPIAPQCLIVLFIGVAIGQLHLRAARLVCGVGFIAMACFRMAIRFQLCSRFVIIERGPTRWEWRVQDSDGVPMMNGQEKTALTPDISATELYSAF
jgi:hypothetical protein